MKSVTEEAANAAKKKKTETAAEKHHRLVNTKLTVLLNKHKEQLKKDIMKKRAVLDKTLHSEIQVQDVRNSPVLLLCST